MLTSIADKPQNLSGSIEQQLFFFFFFSVLTFLFQGKLAGEVTLQVRLFEEPWFGRLLQKRREMALILRAQLRSNICFIHNPLTTTSHKATS